MADLTVGAVVLTYNSVDELSVCLDGLKRQTGVDLRVIVVDNASSAEARTDLIKDFHAHFPEGVVSDADSIETSALQNTGAVFIRNTRNEGYSAGNNIGARFAAGCGCQAVLIVNPDMQISDPAYVQTLANRLMEHPQCHVAASRIIGLDGTDQNGLREAGFWEELLWIRQFGPRVLRPKSFVTPPEGTMPLDVEKVSGCCQMIRIAFLQEIGFMDERVFLYCEEPILAAQVHARGGRLMVFPEVQAVHAHISSRKANSSQRMLNFICSRRYYLRTYSTHGPLRRAALNISYSILYRLHAFKAWREEKGVPNGL